MSAPAHRGGLIAMAVRRPVAVLMVVIALIVFGWVSYRRLRLNLMPDISYPTITLRTEYPGAAPEEIENLVARPIEQALGVVSGLVNLTTISRAEVCDAVLEYEWNTSMAAAAQEIREKLDTIQLPREAHRPLILRYDPQLDPVFRLGLYATDPTAIDLTRLRQIAEDEVQRELETVPGVAAAKVRGGLEAEIRVEIDEAALTSLNLTLEEVQQRLGRENVNLAGGSLREGQTEYLVRTLNEFRSLEEISDLAVAQRSGVDVRLRDIARVVRSHKERTVITRVAGHDSVEIDLFREADSNLIAVADAVRERTFGAPPSPWAGWLSFGAPRDADGKAREDERNRPVCRRLPAGVELVALADQSTFVRGALDEVNNTAIQGGLLSVLVLFLFLRKVALTLIVAIAIPVSIVATFALMHLFHVSLNVMSLGGLALSVGMMVDAAIVVLEAIDRRIENGQPRIEASIDGAHEVAGAVVASTLTTLVVFLPLAFVDGVAGQIFRDQALTVTFGLAASLGVALWLVPMLTARRLGDVPTVEAAAQGRGGGLGFPQFHLPLRDAWRAARSADAGILARLSLVWHALRLPIDLVLDLLRLAALLVILVLGGGMAIVLRWTLRGAEMLCAPFCRLIDWALGISWHVLPALIRLGLRQAVVLLLVCVAAVWGSAHLYGQLGADLMPRVRQGEFTIEMAMPIGTPIEATLAKTIALEAIVQAQPEVERFAAVIGAERDSNRASDEGEHTARLSVFLRRSDDPATTEDRVIENLRRLCREVPGIAALRFTFPVLFTFRNPVEVEVHGHDLETLRRVSSTVAARLARVPGLRDVRSTLTRGHPEVVIRYDRVRLARYGLSSWQVASAIRLKIQGEVATRFSERDRRIEILVRADEADARSVDRVRELIINTQAQTPIPLAAVADIERQDGPSEIRRIGHQRAVVVSGQMAGFDIGRTIEIIERELREIPRPEGIAFSVSGQSRELEVSLKSLNFALLLAAFLVYVVMASQFESLMQPLVIMLTLPLALVGVAPALYLLQIPLSVVAFIGMIVLAGIVVNNAIVLIDFANQLRAEGLPVAEAVSRASVVRLRPILMTTLTTVLGVLPMALGLGEGAEVRLPMAVTIIAGLSMSTGLTLLVIPMAYALVLRDRPARAVQEPARPDAEQSR